MSDTRESTEDDRARAAMRQQIAGRQNAEYQQAQILSLRTTLGPGWKPWMKLSLIPADHRQTGDASPVAVAFKVYRGEERLTANSMFIRRMPDGQLARARNYEELFGELLHEKHPTRTVEVKGQQVPVDRYELVWGALEEYHPRSAEALAKTRQTRERNRAAREEAEFRQSAPLFTTWAEQNAPDETPTASLEPASTKSSRR